jgi:predicted transglutaminase-like cysteine proteinase
MRGLIPVGQTPPSNVIPSDRSPDGRQTTVSKRRGPAQATFRTAIRLVILAALALGLPSPAPHAAEYGKLPPLGFQLFCLKNPDQCRAGGSSSQSLNSGVLRQMRQVNDTVNHTMRARNDVGVDNWTVGGGSGDCEDFALTKRAALIGQGLSASALRIAYVKTRSGEDHAVLVVHTNRGDYVLDNLTSQIKTLASSGLRVISMSGANPRSWNNG